MKFETNIAGVPVNLDYDALPDVSKAFVIEYGLRQYIQDGAAVSKTFTDKARKGQTKTEAEMDAEKKEGVEERVANLMSGEFTRRGTVERLSPEEAKRQAICEEAIRNAAKASGIKLPTKKADPDWWTDRVAKYYEKYGAEVDKEVQRQMRVAAKPVDMTGILD